TNAAPARTSLAAAIRSGGWVDHFDQIEPLGGRGRTAGAAVARRQGRPHRRDAPLAFPPPLQRAHPVSHLMVEERARAGLQVNLLSQSRDLEAVERLHRRFRLAERIAKAGEIVLADEDTRAFLHRLDIEAAPDMPDTAALQRRRRSPVQD